jgi:SsrA-binding protein
MPSFATNREAHHSYQIDETIEAGLALSGPEVKAVKAGNCSLKGAYASIRNSQLFILNMHIGRYQPAAQHNPSDPTRSRRLLVHRSDIDRLIGKMHSQGMSLIPLSVYSKGGLLKVELGLGRGKKAYDKRASIKKRETDRKIARAMRVKG